MNFKRPILFLIFLCVALITGLIVTHILRPQLNQRIGGALFSVSPDSIVAIQCDVKDEEGQWCTVKLKREGASWSFVSPYKGMMCDVSAVTKLLALSRQMRVSSVLGKQQDTNFEALQYLTFSTVEQDYTCGFNLNAEMDLSRMAVVVDEDVVTIDASVLNALPKTVSELRSRALLSFIPEDYILELMWRKEGAPFMRATRLPDGDWEVSQADVFRKRAEVVTPVLEALVRKDLIAAYVYTSSRERSTGEGQAFSDELLKYGLDLEDERLSVRVRGEDSPIVFSFGNASTAHPGFVYCLLHASQSIVLVPSFVRDFFNETGPFAVEYANLPLVEKGLNPTSIEIQQIASSTHATYVRVEDQWENKALGLVADAKAMEDFLACVLDLRGDLVNIQSTELKEAFLQIEIRGEKNETTTLLFSNEEKSGRVEVYCKETKRLYSIAMEAFPKLLLSATLAHDMLERKVLQIDPATIKKITIERPGEPTLAIARDVTVTGGWRTIQPAGAYVDTKVVEVWLNYFANLPANNLKVLDRSVSLIAPWGTYEDGTPKYQFRMVIDLDGSDHGLRNTLLFATTKQATDDVPMIVQGRSIEYMIAPKIVSDLICSPFVYEDE